MLEKVLTAGDKVEVMRTLGSGINDKEKKVYYSLLTDIDEEDRLTLTMPVEGTRLVTLEIGERYWFVFYSQHGIYQTRGLILSRGRQGKIPVMSIKTMTELERIQRRQFFRIECVMDISYRVMDEKECKGWEIIRTRSYRTAEEKDKIREILETMDSPWFYGIAVDISGGGMRFNTQEVHETPKYIKLKFSIEMGNTIKEMVQVARIIRYAPLQNSKGIYEFRVEFVEISTKAREDIVQFVFLEDRKRRTKLQEK